MKKPWALALASITDARHAVVRRFAAVSGMDATGTRSDDTMPKLFVVSYAGYAFALAFDEGLGVRELPPGASDQPLFDIATVP